MKVVLDADAGRGESRHRRERPRTVSSVTRRRLCRMGAAMSYADSD
jgi:hypothetical protein